MAWLASLGVGLLPGPQGTYASVLVAGLAALWLALGGGPLLGPGYWLGALMLAALAVAVSEAAWRLKVFGPEHDPGQIVIDEAAGMVLALHGCTHPGWLWLAALLAFRFFDILKPWPVGWSQRLPGGWGIVVDDLLAGLYALGVVKLLGWWLA